MYIEQSSDRFCVREVLNTNLVFSENLGSNA